VKDRLDDVFGALADPTRRHVVERLVEGGPETATALARDLPISRQAVVKHLQSLSDAGLVDAAREGREVRYAVRPEPLSDAIAWMMQAGAQWDRRLERLQRHLRT
jgi:DNA-binding transcriptional ArsR family regulator